MLSPGKFPSSYQLLQGFVVVHGGGNFPGNLLVALEVTQGDSPIDLQTHILEIQNK